MMREREGERQGERQGERERGERERRSAREKFVEIRSIKIAAHG